MKDYYVYFMTNKRNTALYTGVTSELDVRVAKHKSATIPGFTAKYNLNKLVYFEHTTDVHAAIAREKQLKGWRRSKKDALVNATNPTWKDLSADWLMGGSGTPAGDPSTPLTLRSG